MASSRPSNRPRNPTSKTSADANGDFSNLLPYQQCLATETAARKAAEQAVAAAAATSSSPPLSSNAPSLPRSAAANPPIQPDQRQEASSVGLPSSSMASNKRPSTTDPLSGDEGSSSSGGDEPSGKGKAKKKQRRKKKSRADQDSTRDHDGMHKDMHVMDIDDSDKDEPKEKRNVTADVKHFFKAMPRVPGHKSGQSCCESCL
ncbi:hypothetical protein CPB84DRAFT_1821348 [Gymnopilus junonius]|uniref:Uncharacterized protein n=1 Tax=Gymnopilus junonius TaxID=109634 RepID=A0A9P5NYA1_GYMJU|nr:hypothetical protein CPB84DRAFT_1821348 [Gymnopilus junonius]